MSRAAHLTVAPEVEADCRRRIAAGSQSFALAARLLPRRARRGALVVYAWCRRADNAIDRASPDARAAALAALQRELDLVAAGRPTGDRALDAFGTVARATGMPFHYPREMLAGMRMDLERATYDDLQSLLHYCYRVAGTVGLMMSHVMGLRDDAAMPAAARLGMAMQLTNICRDVVEDWGLGRLYLPRTLLQPARLEHLPALLGGPFPVAARDRLRPVVTRTLDLAARFYGSAEEGFLALPWRAALSIRAARGIYAAIGGRIRAAGCDVTAGRAVVPLAGKLGATAGAAWAAAAEMPARSRAGRGRFHAPRRLLRFTELEPA